MSAVTHSASLSLTNVFNTVSTTAVAATKIVDSLSAAAEVGNMHARRWADRTLKVMLIEAEDENIILVHETARKTILRLKESKTFITKNPDLESDYNELVARYEAAITPKSQA